jgi:lipooligosaccharide transport system permease protein
MNFILTPFLALSHRSFRVLQRHKDVFMKMWKTSIFPPFIDPIFYLFGMGYGLGALVVKVEGMSYAQFIAPGLISSVIMSAPFFECTIGAFVRLKYQNTWDAMISTPVSIEDVVTGEILYGCAKSLLQGGAILIVVALFGLVLSPWALLIPLVCIFAGFMFGAIAMVYTSFIPELSYVDYFFTLLMTPMFIFAGTFFPVKNLPFWAQKAAYYMPLYHTVNINRMLITGRINSSIIDDLIWVFGVGLIFFFLSLKLMRRRVIK